MIETINVVVAVVPVVLFYSNWIPQLCSTNHVPSSNREQLFNLSYFSFLWTSRSLPSPKQKSPASLCDFHCKKGLEVTVFTASKNPWGRRLTPRKLQTLDCHSNFLMHLITSFIVTSFNITDWNLFCQFEGRAPQLLKVLLFKPFQYLLTFKRYHVWWKVLSLSFAVAQLQFQISF